MAFSLYGTGTIFYGQRDFRPDGSYRTTEFVSIFHVPLVPRRTIRVGHTIDVNNYVIGYRHYVIGYRHQFAMLGETAPDVHQVIAIYAFVAVILSALLLALSGMVWIGLPVLVGAPLALALARRSASERGRVDGSLTSPKPVDRCDPS